MIKFVQLYLLTLVIILPNPSLSKSNPYDIAHIITPFQNISETTYDKDCLSISFSASSQITYQLTIFTNPVFHTTAKMFTHNFDYLENAPYTSYFINNNPTEASIIYIVEQCKTSQINTETVIFLITILFLICFCTWCIVKHGYFPIVTSRRSSNTRLIYYQSLLSQSSQSHVSSSDILEQIVSSPHLQTPPKNHQSLSNHQ